MKKFYTINLVILLLLGVTITHAQDKNNNWQFSFGVNAVDLDADTQTKIPEFFDADNYWNISKSPVSYISLSKYLENNISFGLSGSFSTISKYTGAVARVVLVKWDVIDYNPTLLAWLVVWAVLAHSGVWIAHLHNHCFQVSMNVVCINHL